MGQQAGIPLWQWQISLDFLNQMQVVVFFFMSGLHYKVCKHIKIYCFWNNSCYLTNDDLFPTLQRFFSLI